MCWRANSIQFAVLRNADIVGNVELGGDVDILVSDVDRAAALLQDCFGSVVRFAKRSYVQQYYFYVDGFGGVHIDLTPWIEWHGARDAASDVLFSHARSSNGSVIKLAESHEALICWFASLLWGGFFKERYRDLIVNTAADNPAAFEETLSLALGPRWARQLLSWAASGVPERSVADVRQIRRAVWLRSFRRAPIETVKGWLVYWVTEVRLRLSPPGLWVVILGPDGSGRE